jgi:hypothetical protein
MLTVRHMERLWDGRKYDRLLSELISLRIEAPLAGQFTTPAYITSAAFALVRLDELNQSHAPLSGKLIRAILVGQESDGGWGDVMTTALCVRALSLSRGHGEAIDRGIACLAQLQQPSGVWPNIAIRRMPADAMATAMVLLQLGENEAFRKAVHFDEAVEWFKSHPFEVDPAARKLWSYARMRNTLAKAPPFNLRAEQAVLC